MKCGFRVGRWIVDQELGEIGSSEEKVALKPRLMELLVYLAEHPGEVLSKEHLLDTLWKDTFVAENTLMNAVSELRKALGDDRRNPEFITTHSKRGYRLIAPVTGAPKIARANKSEIKAKLRLAVLPFVSRGSDPSAQSVAERLTNIVITALAGSSVLRVVSQTSTLYYRRKSVTLPELGRQLKVQRVLEGEVLRSQGHLQVTVRVYNELDEGLWGEVIDLGSTPASLKSVAQGIIDCVEGEILRGSGSFKAYEPITEDSNLVFEQVS